MTWLRFLNSNLTLIPKQKKNRPYNLAEEVSVIWSASKGYLDEMPIDRLEEFEEIFLEDLRLKGKNLMARINKNKILEKEDETALDKIVKKNVEL